MSTEWYFVVSQEESLFRHKMAVSTSLSGDGAFFRYEYFPQLNGIAVEFGSLVHTAVERDPGLI